MEWDPELTGASNVAARLSLKEKLYFLAKTLTFTLPCILWNISYDLTFKPREVFSRPFRMTALKCALQATKLTLREQRAIAKPTGVIVSKYCAAKGISHEHVLLTNDPEDGNNTGSDIGEEYQLRPALLHFVGCSPIAKTKGKKVFIYFHGGGYTMPLAAGQLRFAERAAQTADADLVVLEYTLIPQLKYPGQLAQGAAAIRYLLKSRDASDIIIAGDSAGANMCLSLLAHLREPHPLVEPIFPEKTPSQKLRGALCISPRCANSNKAASFTYNDPKDIISGRSMDSIVDKWGTEMDEVWAAPLHGGKEFWKDIFAERMLLAGGEDEVYVDDIKEFAALVGAKDVAGADSSEQPNAPYEVVICPGEFHVQCVLDVALGCEKGLMLNTVLAWLKTI